MSQVKPTAVKRALIQVFKQWGMPKSIRVDNGAPLGDPSRKVIPELALWLTALDITVLFNRPGQPTDNAVVERLQRTTQHWAEVQQAKHYKDLEQRLEQASRLQREHFPVRRLGKQTRLAAFPELKNNPRSYNPKNFEAQKAYDRLAECALTRKVSCTGQITLYYQVYYIGRHYKRQFISVKFDPKQRAWCSYDAKGQLIKTCPAKSLNPTNIKNLSLSHKKRNAKKQATLSKNSKN